MKNYCKYENDEIKFLFSLSEKEAYILKSMMQKNAQSDSHLWKRLACSVLNAIDNGFKRYQDEIQKRNVDTFNKEYECNWTIFDNNREENENENKKRRRQ